MAEQPRTTNETTTKDASNMSEKVKLADAVNEVASKPNAEDFVLYALPYTAPELIYAQPPMGRVKQRGQSNRKEKTISKNKRKMVNASKRKNRKR